MNNLVPITLRVQYGAYRPGQTAGFVPEVAERLIAHGWAVAAPVVEPVSTKIQRDTAVKNKKLTKAL